MNTKKTSTTLKINVWAKVIFSTFVLATIIFPGASIAQPDYTPIYDIQYSTDPSGDSPYKDQAGVTTEGVVTAVFNNGFFIEDPAGGAWNGLFVYTNVPVAQGYRVRLTGTIVEYYNLTEMTNLTEGELISSGNPLPAPVVLPSGDIPQEQWESVLVRVENVIVTNDDLGYGEWAVSDGSGDAILDDKGAYTYIPATGDTFSAIIGPLDYSYGAFKIQPRFDQDFISGLGDECPDDPNKTEPGVCGCGTPDIDSDGDTVEDCNDICPNDEDNDADGDGVCGDIDNCPATTNPSQENNDNDSLGDACDEDNDNDGLLNENDSCPFEDAAGQDSNKDGCINTIDGLSQIVEDLDLNKSLGKSLFDKIGLIRISIETGDIRAAINQLNALIKQIETQTGKKITTDQAISLIAYIDVLKNSLGADAKWIICEELEPSVSGDVCEVTTGDNSLLIKGDVLDTNTIYRGGEVLVDDTGLILYVGCSSKIPLELGIVAAQATKIECAEGVISPGLINAHDHLNYNQNYPFPATDERYDHRNDWRSDPNVSAPGSSDPAKMTWSEIRQAMTGTTSIAGAGYEIGFLRNLDPNWESYPIYDDLLWDVFSGYPTEIITDTFPLENAGEYQQYEECSDYTYLGRNKDSYTDVYVAHLSEGVNAAAHNEFSCLSSTDNGGVDIVDNNFAMIHGIALDAHDGRSLADDGASVIWSPRSNISLYGNTAPVTMLKNQGVLLSLSTDWTPSGSMNLGRELVCADTLNKKYLDHTFTDRELWLMVTSNPAEALQVNDKIGSLKAGLFADIAIYDGGGKLNPYRAVIEADAESTVLVLRRSSMPFSLMEETAIYLGSIALYGDAGLVASLPSSLHDISAPQFGISGPLCEPLDVCGADKLICTLRENWWLSLFGYSPLSHSDLEAVNTDSYPLFFCEDPPDEPTCIPLRSGEYDGMIVLNEPVSDSDGDGIIDTEDNCPKIFNPIRLMDTGIQSDTDDDGLGDVCDESP